MPDYNYRAIIEPFGDTEKEKDLVRILAQACGGCGLFPLVSETYVVQTSQPIPQECMDSLQKSGLSLEDYIPRFQVRPSAQSGRVLEANKHILVR